MKRTFLIFTFLILLVGYIIFIQKQSELVAGEYRYYTLYEEYKAKEKIVDYSANAYEKDIHKLKYLKNKLINETEILDKYRVKLNSYYDSISINGNTVTDYNRYVSNLKELKLKIDNQKENILNFENQLNELYIYIFIKLNVIYYQSKCISLILKM
jgi:predicted RNase H-like nuclease (RuvC/YqgF family)